MKLSRIAAATAAAAAAIAIVSGCGTAHHAAVSPARPAATSQHSATLAPAPVKASTVALRQTAPADPSLAWLESRGGQAQVNYNDAVDDMAMDLETESHSDTVANHLAFEADARTVRAQAQAILTAPALQPHVHRAAYQQMLHKFITMADLLQPGADYGTTPQDYTAWYNAMRASNITVW
jgi:PBP1b-binding outer membrane lipoprotein LpoB